jgi:hypothetical protein
VKLVALPSRRARQARKVAECSRASGQGSAFVTIEFLQLLNPIPAQRNQSQKGALDDTALAFHGRPHDPRMRCYAQKLVKYPPSRVRGIRLRAPALELVLASLRLPLPQLLAAAPPFLSMNSTSYLSGGSFSNGSTTARSIGAKWRLLRERIVRSCRWAVAAIAISAKPGE